MFGGKKSCENKVKPLSKYFATHCEGISSVSTDSVDALRTYVPHMYMLKYWRMYNMSLCRIRMLGLSSHFSPGRPVPLAYLFEAIKYILVTLHGDSCTVTLHSGVGKHVACREYACLDRCEGDCMALAPYSVQGKKLVIVRSIFFRK